MGDLTGRHALVTGGGSGIGAAIAQNLARHGARVTISGRREEPLREQSKDNPGINYVIADITDADSVKSMYQSAEEQSGPVDIVVANAGIAKSAPIGKTGLDLWNEMINVNLTGTYLTLREAIDGMVERKWGRLVSVASTAGIKGAPYISAYSSAKHGVVGLTRSLALELAPSGVTVNAVCPGYTETAIVENAIANIMAKTGFDEEKARQALTRTNPMGKIVQPEEVAAAVNWLVGPGSDSITGQSIAICGGETW